jgi:hypothetical protein
MKKLILVLLLMFSLVSVSSAESGFFGAPPEGSPSILNYGWDGMTLGALLGLSTGYLHYLNDNETKNLGINAAYGALIGTAGGLALGFSDASKGRKGYGAIVLRDMHLGGNLGLVVGAIVGGLQYSSDKEWKRVPKGMAWGYLGGAAAGLAIAFYEGPKLVDYSENSHFHYSAALLADSKNNLCPGCRINYRF